MAVAGCVPLASGPYGAHLDAAGKPSAEAAKAAKLNISAGEVTTMSSSYFGEIEFTFENKTAVWVRIENIALDFGSEKNNRAVSFPWGAQLDAWEAATHQRNAIRELNDALVFEFFALGGALVSTAAPRNARALHVAGGLASLAAVSAMAAQGAGGGARLDDDGTPVFEGPHLFVLPLEVPPGLFSKRYLVVNTPEDPSLGCLTKVIMTYELGDKTSHRVALDFRSVVNQRGVSKWQESACPRGEP